MCDNVNVDFSFFWGNRVDILNGDFGFVGILGSEDWTGWEL